jgi:hypothetical protein
MRILRIAGPLAVTAALALPAAEAHAQTLKGSRGSVERMYGQARRQDLTFYRSGRGVRSAAAEGDLVRLRGNDDYRVAGASYAYGLPATRTFVHRLASQYRDACGERLVVTSATRPRSMRLRNSVTESVHPTGMAVDLRRPTRGSCLRWLRETLLAVEREGAIDATEERRPPHFHVAVFPRQYSAYVSARTGGRKSSGSRSARATYRVREGDSLWTIARRHGVTVARIKEANGMRGSHLAIGQTLVIPGGS